ncbi:MAG: prepilin-type N-terminal cleavage/methylation domain-containing protein, partial [Bacilli bacterium]
MKKEVKKNMGFTLVELLAVLIILVLISIIIYPRINNIIETNKKKSFLESVKSTIRSYNSYLASENYPEIGDIDVTEGTIPTIEKSNWKTGIISRYGNKTYVENFYDGNFCAYGYEESLGVYRGKCTTTPSACFDFDPASKTITNYKTSET